MRMGLAARTSWNRRGRLLVAGRTMEEERVLEKGVRRAWTMTVVILRTITGIFDRYLDSKAMTLATTTLTTITTATKALIADQHLHPGRKRRCKWTPLNNG